MISEEESENISEIEQILNKDNQYVTIAIGEKETTTIRYSKENYSSR